MTDITRELPVNYKQFRVLVRLSRGRLLADTIYMKRHGNELMRRGYARWLETPERGKSWQLEITPEGQAVVDGA